MDHKRPSVHMPLERRVSLKILLSDPEPDLVHQVRDIRGRLIHRCHQLLLRAQWRQEYAQQRLELERYALWLLRQPLLQRRASRIRDRVRDAWPTAYRLVNRRRQPQLRQLLGLGVDVAFGPWPEVAQ